MRVELDSVKQIGDGFSITGSVNGHQVALDLPTNYVTRMGREDGRHYMRRCLVKVWCAMNNIDLPDSL